MADTIMCPGPSLGLLRGLRPRRYAQATPFKAKLSDSVPPEVNTTSRGRQPSTAATCLRAVQASASVFWDISCGHQRKYDFRPLTHTALLHIIKGSRQTFKAATRTSSRREGLQRGGQTLKAHPPESGENHLRAVSRKSF